MKKLIIILNLIVLGLSIQAQDTVRTRYFQSCVYDEYVKLYTDCSENQREDMTFIFNDTLLTVLYTTHVEYNFKIGVKRENNQEGYIVYSLQSSDVVGNVVYDDRYLIYTMKTSESNIQFLFIR